jgi:hypothetical protein
MAPGARQHGAVDRRDFPFFLFALDDVGKGLVTTTW